MTPSYKPDGCTSVAPYLVVAGAAGSVALLAGLLLAAAPAAAEVTRGSFDRPPFYDGRLPADARPVAHVAVSSRDEPGSLDPTPDASPALAALLDSLRAELDRLGLTRALPGGDWPMRDGPRIGFGPVREGPAGDESLAGLPADDPRRRRMTLVIEDAGRAWKERVRGAAGDSIRAVLVVQLGFGEQWVRQTSWKGRKAIEIGSGREMPVPWLTSLDDPVQVLYLTGAVLTPAGRVLRAGAEGLLARRTGMAASVLGAQEVLTDEDLATLHAGEGAAWRTALGELVRRLLEPGRR